MTKGKPFSIEADPDCAFCGCLESQHLGPRGALTGGMRPCAGGCKPHCNSFKVRRRDEDDPEMVNHPSHYGGDKVYEAIKVMEAWAEDAGWDAVQITNLTMTLKYIRRHGQKAIAPADQDLEKAIWHLKRTVAHLRRRDG